MKKLTTITTLLALAFVAGPSAFASGDFPSVPDAGSTAVLMGLSLVGIGFIRRMLTK